MTDTVPYTDASLARLVVSAEAAELSDFAREVVSISPGLRPDGRADGAFALIEDVGRLAREAARLCTAAVVAGRLAGATWEDVGAALDISKQSAHDRYAAAEAEFRAALVAPPATEPLPIGELRDGPYAHAAARDPEGYAADLDQWVRAAPGDGDEKPVSSGLVRMDPHAELASLSNRWHAMVLADIPRTDLAWTTILERQVELWRQLATDERSSARTRRSAAESLALLEANLATYRRAASTGK